MIDILVWQLIKTLAERNIRFFLFANLLCDWLNQSACILDVTSLNGKSASVRDANLSLTNLQLVFKDHSENSCKISFMITQNLLLIAPKSAAP